jgi:hypothetical protein
MARAVPRSVRMRVQSSWHEVWKREIRAAWVDSGGGRG